MNKLVKHEIGKTRKTFIISTLVLVLGIIVLNIIGTDGLIKILNLDKRMKGTILNISALVTLPFYIIISSIWLITLGNSFREDLIMENYMMDMVEHEDREKIKSKLIVGNIYIFTIALVLLIVLGIVDSISGELNPSLDFIDILNGIINFVFQVNNILLLLYLSIIVISLFTKDNNFKYIGFIPFGILLLVIEKFRKKMFAKKYLAFNLSKFKFKRYLSQMPMKDIYIFRFKDQIIINIRAIVISLLIFILSYILIKQGLKYLNNKEE